MTFKGLKYRELLTTNSVTKKDDSVQYNFLFSIFGFVEILSVVEILYYDEFGRNVGLETSRTDC